MLTYSIGQQQVTGSTCTPEEGVRQGHDPLGVTLGCFSTATHIELFDM